MLSSEVGPLCIVPRVAWGQFLPVPVMAGPGGGKLSIVNGRNQEQMQLQPQSLSALHHELRMQDPYEMYCIFCGELGTQADWRELLRGLVVKQ